MSQSDPYVMTCIDRAKGAVALGRRAMRRSLWTIAIVHFGAAGTALSIALQFESSGLARPSESQRIELAALYESVQLAVAKLTSISGNGHGERSNPPHDFRGAIEAIQFYLDM